MTKIKKRAIVEIDLIIQDLVETLSYSKDPDSDYTPIAPYFPPNEWDDREEQIKAFKYIKAVLKDD